MNKQLLSDAELNAFISKLGTKESNFDKDGLALAVFNHYDDQRSYLYGSLAAQNVVMTASGAIAPGTAVQLFSVAEATFLCSIAGVVTATPSSFPAGVRGYVIVGTTTTTAQVANLPTNTIAQSTGSAAFGTFVPSVPIAAGTPFNVGLVAVGTASATQTLGGTILTVGIGPQYV